MADASVPNRVKNPRIPVERHCIVCKLIKPAGDFYAYQYTTNQGKLSLRLDSTCKDCDAADRKLNRDRENERARRRNPEARQKWLISRRAKEKQVVDEKKCNKCGQIKPAAKFYAKSTSIDGLNSQCSDCIVSIGATYKRTIDPLRHAIWRKKHLLKKNYGMTLDAYEAMAADQSGKCLVCNKSDILLVVDHCHDTGRIRGLLCRHCNVALGLLREDKEIVLGLARYIDERIWKF